MEEVITIKVAEEFTDAPGGGLRKDGPKSGQEFREDFLEPLLDKLNNGVILIVDFDGCYGVPTSFMYEAFYDFAFKNPSIRINVKCSEDKLIEEDINSVFAAAINNSKIGRIVDSLNRVANILEKPE